ncbi:Cu+-exporting ATPase [Marinomonas alcarazii]|uniref:Copper-exporting P-type ATPase n=1 Tax=Marinomonas alcarazii TaxID=491949 RepID=A0A318V7U9_9GAMM|nr:heavy metal translocating P-type ATPase [Marinomonas alcarazii]PYF84882.1 Cu+-exporting ATPase [Marinomonas alcarazii]
MTDSASKSSDQKVELTLRVTGMSCQGCVSKVRKFIQVKSPEAQVEGIPKQEQLLVTSDLPLAEIEESVTKAGFEFQGLFNDEHAQKSEAEEKQALETGSEKEQATSDQTTDTQSYQLSIAGMTCAGCVNTVQKALNNAEDVVSAEVNFASHTAQVISKGKVEELIKAVEKSGYQASLIVDAEKSQEERQAREQQEYQHKKKSSILGLGLGVPLMLYGVLGGDMMVSTFTEKVVWGIIGLITLLIMISAGRHYFRGAWKAFRNHQANMDLLIALGTGSAWLYSMLVILAPSQWFPDNTQHLYFEAAVMIIGLINLGQALELSARRKTSKALHRLLDLRPKMATKVEGDSETRVPVADIKVNDILRVRAGDKVPVDGEVVEGSSTVNESMLTGEAEPIEKHQGSVLSAGTVNGQGSLLFKATRVGADTLLAQIITMVGKAQNSKPPISVLADKVSAVFVPSVIIIAIVTALAWFNFGNDAALSYMLVTTISVLIIACPCALGLATPISTMIGIGKAAEYGGLIRNGEALQRASELSVIVLDKTGTITEGKPKVVHQQIAERAQEEFVGQIVTAIESQANHPLADALLAHFDSHKKHSIKLERFESLSGLGAKVVYDGKTYLLGNQRLMKEHAIDLNMAQSDEGVKSTTRVYLSDTTHVLAIFFIEDPIKAGVKSVIEHFKDQGLKVVMLTGDNPETAKAVADHVGIDDYHAQFMPDDKLNWIQALQSKGEVVGMIGDGINDAPALAQADVGFAMGAGTDVAMESADITLIHNDLRGVADVIDISSATLRNIKQNLWGAFTYNSLGIPVAAGVLFPFTGWLLSPVIAGAAMSLSSVTVVMNANRLRLLKVSQLKEKRQEVSK